MLRQRNPDAENLAPTTGGAGHAPSRKPRKGLSARAPLGERGGNAAATPASAPNKGGLSTRPRARRRALGDITNRSGISSAPAPAMPGKTARGPEKKTVARPVPRDASGRVEEPDFVPVAPPVVYEPPRFEFSEDELRAARAEEVREGCDPFGRPLAEGLLRLLESDLEDEGALATWREEKEEEEEDGLHGGLETGREVAAWSKSDWLAVDDFELELQ